MDGFELLPSRIDPRANVVQVFPPAYQYQPTYNFAVPVAFDLFWYVFPTFAALAAATPTTQQLVIQNDSDFECRRILYYEDIAAAAYLSGTQPIPNCTILLTDTGSGRQLMNNPVPIQAVACRGDNPRDLPWPKIFSRNSTIQCTLSNFDAAVTTANYRIILEGRKIFPLA